MMRARGSLCRSSRTVSMPSFSGMKMSVITKSGFCLRKSSIPMLPSGASMTLYPARSRLPRTAARIVTLSSMTRMVGTSGTGASVRDHRDCTDLDQTLRRSHLANLDHGRGRRRRLKIFAADFVDGVEVLHVTHEDVDPADIGHCTSGSLDRRLQVLADL